ncbi:type II toxin-antitoxin system VapB family antitoxin [Phyllobacterium sp. OV277]|jgi:antitoxin VapB|uniref:type II toxin-antitoxin system VapB family antitoxin n=1 Tax=Phyllobacterium sp. OV277 TaxID=1882772 RepID=UPI0008898EB1|nr:type II toxin-antitoxin system VapB family antitoxin [Phyllobacterium sp. OV277]SDP39207.1 antitoxin VapB [Phyllobacterium sp. OV277]
MVLNIRNSQADTLARKLADIDGSSITDAVIVALKETIQARRRKEAPSETARRILEKRGLAFAMGREPVPTDAYHDLDHDLAGDE